MRGQWFLSQNGLSVHERNGTDDPLLAFIRMVNDAWNLPFLCDHRTWKTLPGNHGAEMPLPHNYGTRRSLPCDRGTENPFPGGGRTDRPLMGRIKVSSNGQSFSRCDDGLPGG